VVRVPVGKEKVVDPIDPCSVEQRNYILGRIDEEIDIVDEKAGAAAPAPFPLFACCRTDPTWTAGPWDDLRSTRTYNCEPHSILNRRIWLVSSSLGAKLASIKSEIEVRSLGQGNAPTRQ
jgi:hypothetical protein